MWGIALITAGVCWFSIALRNIGEQIEAKVIKLLMWFEKVKTFG